MSLKAYGKPVIAALFDGSDMAFSGVFYATWVVEGATVEVRLVGSKARVADDEDKNTFRQELNGAVLCTRLQVWTVRPMDMDIKSERFYIMVDS